MRAHPIISSFNGGELSPLLGGRPDTEKYQAGLSLCENFIPRVQGALVRRGGTRFVAEVKDSAKRAWLVRFEYSVTDAFVLEFGDHYIRFFRDHGVFEDTPGNTYEITSPWAAADLTAADGSFALRYVQSGDVIYLAHRNYPPRKLTRVSNINWTLSELIPKGGPFKDQNSDKTITVSASGGAVGATVTLTASAPIFKAGQVGSLFYLEMADGEGIKPWSVNSFVGDKVGIKPASSYAAADGDWCRSDGKYYACTAIGVNLAGHATWPNGACTGAVQPEHTEGRYWDGDGVDLDDHLYGPIGVEWQYMHPGYGWVRITGFTDPYTVSVQVLSLLPQSVVGGGTWRWAHGAWSDTEGWPSCVTFFRQRLTFARDQRLWFSVAGDYETFEARAFGQVEPDSAMSLLIASARGDTIQWLAPVDRLLVGTGGTVFAVGEATATQPFGPVGPNARSEDQALTGSAGVTPVVTPGAVMVVEKAGRILNEVAFSADANKYAELDLTVFAEHMTLSGITDMTFVKQPHSMVVCALANGDLRGFTYMKPQGVSGWHRHAIGGDGRVESVVSVPSPDGRRDDLWMIVRRGEGEDVKRFVEVLTAEYQDGDDGALSAYSDASLVYEGAPTHTLLDLDFLEGRTVTLKVNGAAHPPRTVSGGTVTLDVAATKAVAGLAAPARARLMPLEAGGEGGTAQGRPKRVNRLLARLVNSLGGRFGPDFSVMEAIEYRTASDPMDSPPPLFTGDKTVEFPGDYDGAATVAFECDGEFPFTLVALVPEVTAYGS